MREEQVVLACHNLVKHYHQGPQQLTVLDGIELEVKRGERVAIVGASGSGKSTLLNMLGGLDLPSSGDVLVDDKPLTGLSETQRGHLRNHSLGFVYQFHHLLGEFTAQENVAMPLLIRGLAAKEAAESVNKMLGRVGLSERLSHKPAELSGGERQRVAIARALVTEPACVLMDEPTGNLDRQTAESIHQLINELNESIATSFVVVTHDPQMAERMDRILTLSDGRLMEGHV